MPQYQKHSNFIRTGEARLGKADASEFKPQDWLGFNSVVDVSIPKVSSILRFNSSICLPPRTASKRFWTKAGIRLHINDAKVEGESNSKESQIFAWNSQSLSLL